MLSRQRYAALRGEMAKNSIDELLNLLSSEDLQTRFLAEMCLRDATAT